MVLRWLIRLVFLLPVLVCAGGWGWSYFRWSGLGYHFGAHAVGIWIDNGEIAVTSVQVGGRGWELTSLSSGWLYMLYPLSKYHWGGFAFDPNLYGSPDGHSWFVMFPFWFLTGVWGVLFVLAWRRTRYKGKGTAFPVELAPGKAKPGP